jgi:hypothetical protein
MEGHKHGKDPVSSQTLPGLGQESSRTDPEARPAITFESLPIPQFERMPEMLFITESEPHNTSPTEALGPETAHNTSRQREEMFDQR